MDIAGLVQTMIDDQAFFRLVNDPLAQFGTSKENFLGATILPERPVPDNSFVEQAVRYRTPIANHGTRYSPVQIKEGMIWGEVRVDLGNSDIGAEFTDKQYDELVRLMQKAYGINGQGAQVGSAIRVPTMQAMTQITNWVKTALVDPLLVRNEKDRWDAIVDAQVNMSGDNGYSETVTYPNPTGHRVNVGGTWSSNTYDPWTDVMAAAEFLRAKGYEVGRIIMPVQVRTILSNNLLMRQRAGKILIQTNLLTGIPGRLTDGELNSLFNDDGLPAFELYDRQYFTQGDAASSVTTAGVTVYGNWYLKRTVMVFIAKTGRDEEIDRGDMEPVVVQDTLGYVGVGRPAGQPVPGKAVEIEMRTGKNKGIEGQAWQTSLPVILEPEAIYVLKNIG